MKRLIGVVLALVLGAGLASTALAASTTLPHSGRVLMAVGGDIVVPAGEQADAVIVINGNAQVLGRVSSVVVVDGSATISGTTIESLVLVRGSATVSKTHVLGDIRTFDGQVTQSEVALDGTVRGFEADIVAFGWVLGLGALLIWIGVGITTLAAGLLAAAIAARQLRSMATIIRREPLTALGGGLLGLFVPMLLVAALFVTVVGIPLAVSFLLFVWPTMAFIGYLVTALWLGAWTLERMRGAGVEAERPYLAMVVGLLILFVVGILPLVSAILSFLGFGAVVVAAWRTVRGVPTPSVFQPSSPSPTPVAG